MTSPKRRTNRAGRFLRTALLLLLFSALRFSPSASASPLYVHFIDQLPPQADAPSFNGLEERRRGPVFQTALQTASRAGELPSVIVTNPDIHLFSPKTDEPPIPAGATLARVYLTRWSTFGLGGFAVDEVMCRIFVEVVRDGRTVAKLGPFLGRVPYTLTEMTTGESRYTVFRDAARKAIDEMAHALPRTSTR